MEVDGSMNIHIVLYLSYSCNLRCSYCVITFEKQVITILKIDEILKFIKTNFLHKKSNVFLEFIGGEPLLNTTELIYILNNITDLNIKTQITTNGTLINQVNYDKILSKLTYINLSFNENYYNDLNKFDEVSDIILDKSKVNINFLYIPSIGFKNTKNSFLFLLKKGYKNISILPIVLTYEYTNFDYINLVTFLEFVIQLNVSLKFNFRVIYYLQEKDGHFEFTITPDGNVLGDNMGTAEQFFSVNKKYSNIIGHISNLEFDEIYSNLKNYNYSDYLKNLIINGKTRQSYKNFLKLSYLLEKYDKKISRKTI